MAERSRPHLLLVEDDPALGATLLDRLAAKGYQTTWAQSAREARYELGLGHFHLALLDIGLPDGSGLNLCTEILSRHANTATIFLTSLGNPLLRVQGLKIGADDYVAKSSHFEEIVLRIENALRRRRRWHEVPDQISLGRAHINLPAQEAHVGGKVTHLGTREVALLRLLLSRRGTVVSRDTILDEVWSRDEYPTPRTVDNFIVKLRRLIEVDPEHPALLRTVWGSGYQLTQSS